MTDLALRLLAGKGTLPSMTVRLSNLQRQCTIQEGGLQPEGDGASWLCLVAMVSSCIGIHVMNWS